MKRTILCVSILLLLALDFAFAFQQEYPEEVKKAIALAASNVLSISPCALRPYCSDLCQTGAWLAHPDMAYVASSGSVFADMYAPVYLPNGAIVKKVIGLCSDNDSSSPPNYVLMRLERRNNYANLSQTLAELSTDGLPASTSLRIRKTTDINDPTVDNLYSYSLRVSFGPYGSSGLIFYGFWIIYE